MSLVYRPRYLVFCDICNVGMDDDNYIDGVDDVHAKAHEPWQTRFVDRRYRIDICGDCLKRKERIAELNNQIKTIDPDIMPFTEIERWVEAIEKT